MATINISDLRPIGSDLFSDSEFINDLSEEELNIQGGLIIPFFSPRCAPISISYAEYIQNIQNLIQNATAGKAN